MKWKGFKVSWKRWKADYFGSLCVFGNLLKLCYCLENRDNNRGWHIELKLTELDYTLLLDTVVSRLIITIESLFGWLAPRIFDSKYTHREHTIRSQVTNGISIAVIVFVQTNKSCHFKYRKPRIHWAHMEVPITIQSLLIWYRKGRQWFSIFKSCGRL